MTQAPQEQAAELYKLRDFRDKTLGSLTLALGLGLTAGALYIARRLVKPRASTQAVSKKEERLKKALFPQKRVIQLPPSGNASIRKKELYMNEISDVAANKDGINLVLFQISAPKGYVKARDPSKRAPENGKLSLRDFRCGSDIRELIKQHPSLIDAADGIKILEFEEVFLDSDLQGLGIGANMYLSSLKTFWDANGGKPFIAIPNACRAGSTSPMAEAVWKKMAKKYPSVGSCLAILERPTA